MTEHKNNIPEADDFRDEKNVSVEDTFIEPDDDLGMNDEDMERKTMNQMISDGQDISDEERVQIRESVDRDNERQTGRPTGAVHGRQGKIESVEDKFE